MIPSNRRMLHSPAWPGTSPALVMDRIILALLACLCMAGVLSCLPVNPEEKQVEVLLKTDTVTAPDSVVWISGSSRGYIDLSGKRDGQILRLPLEKMGPAGITLEFWTDSIRTARLVYIPDDERGAALVSKEIDPAAIELLGRLDSLNAHAPSAYPRNTRTLSRIYAEGLIQGTPAFAGYPDKLPHGLAASQIDTLALRSAVQAGLPVDSLSKKWLLPFRADSARKLLTQWAQGSRITPAELAVLFPNRAPRLDSSLALLCADLAAAGPACSLLGSFSDDSAIVSWSARILQGEQDRTSLFEITPPPGTLAASPARWSLRSSTLRALQAPPGNYRLRIEASDLQGQVGSAELAFSVQGPAQGQDARAPSIQLVSPAADTALPAGSAKIIIRAKISDSSSLARVTIGGKPAVLLGASEWMAEVPTPSGANRIWIAASDTHGNADSVALTVTIPPLPRDVRLIDLGLPPTYVQPPAQGDSVWIVAVPNRDTAIDLLPKAADPQASVLQNLRALTRPIHISLSPAGDTIEISLRVQSSTGDTTRDYLIRILHRPPDPIRFEAKGGRTQTIPWADSLQVISWSVTGSRALGAVRIGGLPAGCLSDSCSRRMTLDTGRTTIAIEATYQGLPQIWRDSIAFTRLAQPLSHEAGLARFGTSLPATPTGSDANWTLSVPNAIDWILLAPVPASSKASFTIDDAAVLSKTIFLSPDGDASTHVVAVTSEDGSRTIRYRLRIEHAPPDPIAFTPERGKFVSVPFDSTSALLRWTIRGSRPVGWVELQNGSGDRNRIPLAKISEGIYEHRFDFGANVYGAAKVCTVLVHAGYQGGVREWIDTVIAIRERDTTKPRVVYLTEMPKVVGTRKTATLQFTAVDGGGIASLTLNQTVLDLKKIPLSLIPIANPGEFRFDTLRISATDSSGNSVTDSLIYFRDGKAPDLLLDQTPGSPFPWRGNDTGFMVSGTIQDPHGVILWIDGKNIVLDGTSFSYSMPVQPGDNTLSISYSDSLGNQLLLAIPFHAVLHDDRDNAHYEIRRLPGGSVWMLSNLRLKPVIGIDLGCRSNDCGTYGRWYHWNQAMNLDPKFNSQISPTLLPQGICPDGWQIPTETDWKGLFEAITREWGYISSTEALEDIKDSSGWSDGNNGSVDDDFLLPSHSIGDSLILQFWLPHQQSATQAGILDLTHGLDVRPDFPKDGSSDPAGSHQVIRCIRK